jgi:hypothetical protein
MMPPYVHKRVVRLPPGRPAWKTMCDQGVRRLRALGIEVRETWEGVTCPHCLHARPAAACSATMSPKTAAISEKSSSISEKSA